MDPTRTAQPSGRKRRRSADTTARAGRHRTKASLQRQVWGASSAAAVGGCRLPLKLSGRSSHPKGRPFVSLHTRQCRKAHGGAVPAAFGAQLERLGPQRAVFGRAAGPSPSWSKRPAQATGELWLPALARAKEPCWCWRCCCSPAIFLLRTGIILPPCVVTDGSSPCPAPGGRLSAAGGGRARGVRAWALRVVCGWASTARRRGGARPSHEHHHTRAPPSSLSCGVIGGSGPTPHPS